MGEYRQQESFGFFVKPLKSAYFKNKDTTNKQKRKKEEKKSNSCSAVIFFYEKNIA